MGEQGDWTRRTFLDAVMIDRATAIGGHFLDVGCGEGRFVQGNYSGHQSNFGEPLTLHDAAMMRFGQFWTRMRRGGFAYGLWRDMFDADASWPGTASLRRAVIWACVIPVMILLGMLVFGRWGLVLGLVYPLQITRLARRKGGTGSVWKTSALETVGKFAELQGFVEFYWRKWRGKPAGLIEHK